MSFKVIYHDGNGWQEWMHVQYLSMAEDIASRLAWDKAVKTYDVQVIPADKDLSELEFEKLYNSIRD
jgi:hypothetical protein